MIPVVKLDRQDATIFLNLSQMIRLKVWKTDDKLKVVGLMMSNGDIYSLNNEELELVINTLYGSRAYTLIESLKK